MSRESMRFKPHYNSATGMYHSTKKDYLDTIKKMNLVPYEKPKEKPDPVYKPSKWARDMGRQINRGRIGSVFINELKKKGYDPIKMQQAQEKAKKMGATGNVGGFGEDVK